jgi:hypothetical protein
MERERGRAAALRSLILVSTVGAAVVLVLASLAHGWVQYPLAQNLSAADQIGSIPQIAIDSEERARVVWRSSIGGGRIQTVRLGADGNAETGLTLSPAGEIASQPQLTVDPQDRATIVWRAVDGAIERIRQIRIDADGGTGPVTSLSVGTVLYPQVAADSQGRSTVVWQRHDGANMRIEARRIGADGLAAGATHTLSAAGRDATLPQIAIDSQDRATVVWQRSDGANTRIQARQIGADGTPEGAIHLLSIGGQSASFPQVAIDSQDRATAVWQRSDGTNQRIQSVRFPGTESSQTISAAGRDAIVPQIAIDSQDRATVVWLRSDEAKWRVQSRRLEASGVPGAIRTLSAAGQDAFSPQVAVDPQGRATTAWARFDGANDRIEAIRLRANTLPGAVQTLSAAGRSAENAQVAIDADSRPTVVWQRHVGGGPIIIQLTRGNLAPPDTEITFGPAPGQVTNSSPTFAFAGIPAADVDGFQCRVDSGAFAPCTSPRTIGPLADGPHTFAVRAIDSDGADPTPAQRSFTVDATQPPDGAPPDGHPLNLPAKLLIARAQVRVGASAARRHPVRRLVVRGSVDPRAAGERVVMRFRARGRQIVMRPTVRENGAFQVNRRLRGPQRRAVGGQLRVRYRGDDVLRAAGERLRAARRAVRLRIARIRLRGNRLVVAGRVRPRARGQARIQVEFNHPNGDPAQLATRARVRKRGGFRTTLRVPPAVRNLGAWIAITHRGRARLFGQRRGRAVGG